MDLYSCWTQGDENWARRRRVTRWEGIRCPIPSQTVRKSQSRGWRWGLEAGLQAVKRACRAGGGSWFTGIDGEVDATVNGVVILVGRGGLAGVFPPPPGGIVVRVVDERDAGGGVVYPKLGVRHEVVDGWSRVWFFQAFVEGATERIHDADLPWGESRESAMRDDVTGQKWRVGRGGREPCTCGEEEE